MKLNYVILCAVCTICREASAQAETEQTSKATETEYSEPSTLKLEFDMYEPHRYCSRALSRALNMLCSSQLNLTSDKRLQMTILLPTNNNAPYPVQRQRRRVRRQIVDECCTRQCSFAEMLLYCDDDTDLPFR